MAHACAWPHAQRTPHAAHACALWHACASYIHRRIIAAADVRAADVLADEVAQRCTASHAPVRSDECRPMSAHRLYRPPLLLVLHALLQLPPITGRGMPERREYSPLNPMGLHLGDLQLQATAAGVQALRPSPRSRPNNNPDANNGPNGPGPCGSPSTCVTWATSNPLAGLPALPKLHYSFAFDPHYLEVAHKNHSSNERALLTDMARIMGTLSFSVECGSPVGCDAANRTQALVEICDAAGKAHPEGRVPLLTIQYSPWYSKFWKGGHDECSSDGEAAEMQYYAKMLQTSSALLAAANMAAGTNISFGAVLIDSEQFSWGPPAGSKPGWPLSTHCDAKGIDCTNCCTRKNELVYNTTKKNWPAAEPIFYDWGSAYYSPQGCSHDTARPDKCVNLSPDVPQGWDMELHASFNESFVKDHPFTVSLYNTGDIVLSREEVQQTATNAAMIPGGTHEVLPFIALGASYHKNASNPDIDYQGDHKQSSPGTPFFQATFDFSGLLDGGYDRSNSMVMGAQVNLPMFNSSTSRSVWTSGNDTGPWSYFGPWEKVRGAVFFPGVLEYRSAPSPWTAGSSVILDHFVSYVKGGTDTGLHLGQPPNR